MSDTEKSETGVYFDQDSNTIVNDPPTRGVQIVAPGGIIDENTRREIARYQETVVETAVEPADVETADEAKPRRKS